MHQSFAKRFVFFLLSRLSRSQKQIIISELCFDAREAKELFERCALDFLFLIALIRLTCSSTNTKRPWRCAVGDICQARRQVQREGEGRRHHCRRRAHRCRQSSHDGKQKIHVVCLSSICFGFSSSSAKSIQAHVGDSRCIVVTADGQAIAMTVTVLFWLACWSAFSILTTLCRSITVLKCRYRFNFGSSYHSLILFLLKAEKARIEKAGHDVRRETILQHGKRSFVHRVDGDLVRRHYFWLSLFLNFSLAHSMSVTMFQRPLHVRSATISTKTVSISRRPSRR